MRPRILTVGICLLLVVGCKRGTKDTGPARSDLANAKSLQPLPAPIPPERKAEKKDEPNWLTDKRVQPKRDQLPVDGPASSGKQPWVTGAPEGGFQKPAPGVQPTAQGTPAPVVPMMVPAPPAAQPQAAAGNNAGVKPPALAPAGGGPRGAAARLVAMADMRDLQVLIDTASLTTGKMPSSAEIMAALVQANSPTAALVKDGTIILTGTKERESVWAVEANAALNGGLVVSQNGVERVTAAELKKRLEK